LQKIFYNETWNSVNTRLTLYGGAVIDQERTELTWKDRELKVLESIIQKKRETYAEFLPDIEERLEPYVVACIPALNEERYIAGVIVRVQKYVDHVIVCDDGSVDVTGPIAERLGAQVIRHEFNSGKGAALKTALRHAKDLDPDVVVVLDGDGQHDPKEIPLLIEPILEDESDIVIGSRFTEGGKMDPPLYRRLGLGMIDRFFKDHIDDSVTDSQSGYRAFSREALDVMLETESSGFGVESEQIKLAKIKGLRTVEVPVNIKYKGIETTSKVHPLFHGTEVMTTILRLVIEDKPIQLLGLPGLFALIVGVFSTSILFYQAYYRTYFSLPIAIISTGTILTGLILIITSFILYSINRMKQYSTNSKRY
jgi:glycosyltransferase involved in cell wall biosynthesis